jgi:tetratricopeptide (TPR) repeat protein
MEEMKKLALLLLLAAPAFAAAQRNADGTPEDVEVSTAVQIPSPAPGTLESSKIRLAAHDLPGALQDAEIALSKGGGADAYAARADAKRALGRPVDEAIADYAEAAKLDPRYLEKWKGLIAQKESEAHPVSRGSGGKGLNGVPIGWIVSSGIGGVLLLGVAAMKLRRREEQPLENDDPARAADGK